MKIEELEALLNESATLKKRTKPAAPVSGSRVILTAPPVWPKAMDEDFGRRVRSFLRGEHWWTIVKEAMADGDTNIGALLTADLGLAPGGEDMQFAQAVNWSVTRKEIEVTDVNVDYPGNWWYVEVEAGDPAGASLAVWGKVDITQSYSNLGDVREKGRAFGLSLVLDTRAIDTGSASVEARLDTSDPSGKTYEAEGILFIR